MKAIYKIQNTNTGDFYIGSAVDFTYRKWVHLKRLREGKHHNAILQNSWNKHGENAFLFEVIEEVFSKEELVPREQHFIDTLNPRYNICKIAGSPLGIKHSNEARLNMSIAHLGKKLSPESIAKRTAKVLGSKRTEETKEKMRNNKQCIPVIQYTLDNIFVKEWRSSSEAGRILEINQSHITSCCKGRKKTIGGYLWKYKL